EIVAPVGGQRSVEGNGGTGHVHGPIGATTGKENRVRRVSRGRAIFMAATCDWPRFDPLTGHALSCSRFSRARARHSRTSRCPRAAHGDHLLRAAPPTLAA